jgi:hypothetical protein
MKNIFTFLIILVGLTALKAQPCTPIQGISFYNITTTKAVVAWQPVAGISNYTVAYKPSNTIKWVFVANPKSQSASLGGLSAGVTYDVAIAVANCVSPLPVVPSQGKLTTAACSTITPSNLQVAITSNATASVSWNTVIGEEYDMEYRVKGSTPLSTERITATSTKASIALKNLVAGTTYQVSVKAACSGYFMTPVDYTTPQCPPDPTFQIANISQTSARISWAMVGNSDGYSVEYAVKGATNILYVKTNALFADLNNLQPNTTYVILVRHNACWHYSIGLITEFTTKNCPYSVTANVVNLTPTSAQISFEATIGDSYRLSYMGSNTTFQIVTKVATKNPESFLLENLTPNTAYSYEVRPSCAFNSTAGGAMKPFTTPCNPPAMPLALQITENGVFVPNLNPMIHDFKYREKGTAAWQMRLFAGQVPNIKPKTEYEYQYNIICGSTLSPLSSIGTFTSL